MPLEDQLLDCAVIDDGGRAYLKADQAAAAERFAKVTAGWPV